MDKILLSLSHTLKIQSWHY